MAQSTILYCKPDDCGLDQNLRSSKVQNTPQYFNLLTLACILIPLPAVPNPILILSFLCKSVKRKFSCMILNVEEKKNNKELSHSIDSPCVVPRSSGGEPP